MIEISEKNRSRKWNFWRKISRKLLRKRKFQKEKFFCVRRKIINWIFPVKMHPAFLILFVVICHSSVQVQVRIIFIYPYYFNCVPKIASSVWNLSKIRKIDNIFPCCNSCNVIQIDPYFLCFVKHEYKITCPAVLHQKYSFLFFLFYIFGKKSIETKAREIIGNICFVKNNKFQFDIFRFLTWNKLYGE